MPSLDDEDRMIARLWHGAVPASKGEEYLDLMRRIALPEYRATRGNRCAWCLHRTDVECLIDPAPGVEHYAVG